MNPSSLDIDFSAVKGQYKWFGSELTEDEARRAPLKILFLRGN